MPFTYKGYELNSLAEPSNWSPREIDLFKDIIDKLPVKGATLVVNEHKHSKLVASDGSPDPAIHCDAAGNLVVGQGLASADPNALVHIFKATAGTVTGQASSILLLESDGAVHLEFLSPATVTSGIYWSNPTKTIDGYITYNPVSHRMDFGCDGLYMMRLRRDDSYVQIQNGYAIRAGGAAGISLHDSTGVGIKIQNTDVIMDAGARDIYKEIWQAYTSNATGFSSFTANIARYKKVGRLVFVEFELAGTGNGIATEMDIPHAPNANAMTSRVAAGEIGGGGTRLNTAAMINTAGPKALFTDFGSAVSGDIWGNGNTKWVCGHFWYESAA